MKQIKHMIQMREKAEQEKQATNQAILDEHIIDEIEQDLRACHCHDDGDSDTPTAPSSACIKSCLKKTPSKEVLVDDDSSISSSCSDEADTSKTKNHRKTKKHKKKHQASKEYSPSSSSNNSKWVFFGSCFTGLR